MLKHRWTYFVFGMACLDFLIPASPCLAHSTYSTAVEIQDNVEGSGHSGGGNITEVELRYFMGKIDDFLDTDEGQKLFPEVVEYDVHHSEGEKFHDLILKTKPVVKRGRVFDEFGVERDCVSHINPNNRYFVCNSKHLPDDTVENQRKYYGIVMHELFVQAGIEKPLSKDVPSEYDVSDVIMKNMHLGPDREWVFGLNEKTQKTCNIQ